MCEKYCKSERKGLTGLSKSSDPNTGLKKRETRATFQPQGTGPAAASLSKKGQNTGKRTSCLSEGQDGNQAERMTTERT